MRSGYEFDPEVEKIAKDISLRRSIPIMMVKEIIYCQFKMVKDAIERGLCENVGLTYFGKFGVSKAKKIKYAEQIRENRRRLEECGLAKPRNRKDGETTSEDM